ncbi:site-specific integrase [Dyella sp. 333MFSha]|uniref:site-specific integrase n=1 Tax=Dyella sp. 333MFSha TaxID=1798240 RepID=UPI0008827FDA|nr:site-specific integrase [Dyella sp. 333MFSha]SDG06421.1 Site-specific recombinase XerD [Dyella sp. 333MFSha]
MFSEYGGTSPVQEHLYDVVATPSGVRLSPNCERGHELVVELMARLGLFAESSAPMTGVPPQPTVSAAPATTAPSLAAVVNSAPPRAALVKPAAAPVAAAAVPEVAIDDDASLSRLTTMHLSNMDRGGLKNRSSVRERRYILGLLEQIIGDKPVTAVTAADAEMFADTLSQWPAYRHNHADFAHMSPAAIVKRTEELELPTIQRSTQAKHIKAINAFFAWCIEAGLLTQNPFRFIQMSRYRELMPRKKEPFTEEDIKALFSTKRIAACDRPHKFWVPLIAMLTGMRVNEICQLFRKDVRVERVRDTKGVEHAILCFEVTPHRKNQRLKTPYAQRLIPVHSMLLKLGFQDYLEDLDRLEAVHLFPGLNWSGDGPGRAMTQWFNAKHRRQEAGIDVPTKTLHCFRHTINTLADRCSIPDSIMTSLNGHADGEGVRARTYVARATLVECQTAIESLPFPTLAVPRYKTGQYDAYLKHALSAAEHETNQRKAGKPVARKRGRPTKCSESSAPARPLTPP